MHFNNVFQTIKKSNVNFHGLKDSGWVVPNFFLKISFVVSINYFGVGGWVDLTKMNRFQLFYYYFALLRFSNIWSFVCEHKEERGRLPKQDAYTDPTSAKTKPMMAKLFYIVKNTLPNKTWSRTPWHLIEGLLKQPTKPSTSAGTIRPMGHHQTLPYACSHPCILHMAI